MMVRHLILAFAIAIGCRDRSQSNLNPMQDTLSQSSLSDSSGGAAIDARFLSAVRSRDTSGLSGLTYFYSDTIIDVNLDGLSDTISAIFLASTPFDAPGDPIHSVIVSVNQSHAIHEGEELIPRIQLVDIDTADTHIELAIADQGPSDDYKTYYFYYDGSSIKIVGSVEDADIASRKSIVYLGNGVLTALLRREFLCTWFSRETYKLDAEVGLKRQPQKFYLMNYPVVVTRPLPGYRSHGDTTISTMFRPGDAVVIGLTDFDWCELRATDGRVAWIVVDEDEIILNNGSRADYVFDGLRRAD